MTIPSIGLLLAMTSAEAIAVLLNSQSAVGAKTFADARAIVERDAAEGRPLQQFVIGVTTDDPALKKKYLEASRGRIEMLASEKDNPLAWYLLSMEKNDMRLLKRAAEGGNVQALNALGTILTQQTLESAGGLGSNRVETVLKQCFGYFSKAAESRDPNGFINLGACYLRGFGCERDMELAFQCFRSAAELGHPEGMDNMSAMYQFGHGVEKNSEMSLYWAMRGRAARGDEAAVKWLRTRK